MTLLNALSAALIVLILGTLFVLFLGMRPASAGLLDVPLGGWGIEGPAPAPDLEPGGGGRLAAVR